MAQTMQMKTLAGNVVTLDNTRDVQLALLINAVHQSAKREEGAAADRREAIQMIADRFGSGKHVVPGFGEITISENNVYDEDVIMAGLTPWQFARKASKRVLDRAKVRANFPALYEAAREQRGWRGSAKRY